MNSARKLHSEWQTALGKGGNNTMPLSLENTFFADAFKELGRQEGLVIVAEKMIANSRPIEEILELTELPREVVEKLYKAV